MAWRPRAGTSHKKALIALLAIAIGATGCFGGEGATGGAFPAPGHSLDAAHFRGLILLQQSWTDVDHGWVLATRRCLSPGNSCPLLISTSDGGDSWLVRSAPPAQVNTDAPSAGTTCSSSPCISSIVFPTNKVGFAFAPDLFMTTDGAATWHRIPGPTTLDVAPGGHFLRAVSTCDLMARTPPCTDSLETVATNGAASPLMGPPFFGLDVQLSAQGHHTYVFSQNSGARPTLWTSVGSDWQPLPGVCPQGAGARNGMAAPPGNAVIVLCGTSENVQPDAPWETAIQFFDDQGAATTAPRTVVVPRIGSVPPSTPTLSIAATSPSAIVLGQPLQLLFTKDGGDTWQVGLASPTLGFNDGSLQAVGNSYLVIGPGSRIWRSQDEGTTWKPISPKTH